MRQAIHQPFTMTQVISFGLVAALLSLFQPTPTVSAQQLTRPVSQETDEVGTHGRRFENIAPILRFPAKSLETKDAQTLTNKPHRLIRKPQNAPVASVEPSPADSSHTKSLPTPPSSLQSDNATSQPNEPSSLYRNIGAAVPLATMSAVPLPATATGSIAAGTAPTGTIPLAAAGSGSSGGSGGGRSMSRLAAEMPGLAQLITPPSAPAAAPTATLTVTPASLAFTATQNAANPANQSLTITSNTAWTVSTNASWLTVTPSSGSNNGTPAVSVNTATAVVGANTGTITVTGGGITRTVSVTLTLTAPTATLTVTPASLAFTATQGAADPANQTITVASNGAWTVTKSTNTSWLTVNRSSGSSNGTITVSVNTSTAIVGNNTGTVTISGGGISRIVNVTLTLNAPATSSLTLTWNANTASDLAGYKVYRATSSGAYGAPLTTLLGNVTSYTATGLTVNSTYFFVITAYDLAGNESAFSNEVNRSVN